MAENFNPTRRKAARIAAAANLMFQIEAAYNAMVAVVDMVAELDAGTDQDLNMGVTALYNTARIAEIRAVADSLRPVRANLEVNHASLVRYVAP